MITIQQTPNLVALAGSRQPWKLHSNKLNQTEGGVAVLEITLTGFSSAGQKFKLAWGSFEIEFLCAASPDDSGRQFGVQASGSYQDVALKIFQCLAANYYISRDFEVSNPTGKARLQARKKGTAYSLTFTNGGPGISCTTSNQAGINQVPNPNFRIVLQVILGGTVLAEEALTSFLNSVAEADVAEILLPEFVMEFDFPETGNPIKYRAGMLLAYSIKYAEAFGDPLAVYQLKTSNTYYLLNGGLSREMEALYNQTPAQFWADWVAQKRFLSLHPTKKRVSKTAIEKLYWLDVFKFDELNLMKKLVNFDGSENIYTEATIAANNPYRVYEINCSLSSLMPLSHQEDIKQIEVWLEDELGNVVSEVRTFVIDHRAQAQSRSFIFLNSLGAYETMHCTGEFDTSSQIDSQEAMRILQYGFTRRDREISQINPHESRKVKANTGYQFSRMHQDWLRDFLLSREAFEIVGDRLLPVNIDPDSHRLYRDGEGLYALEFSYQPAYRNEFYGIDPEHIVPFDHEITGLTGGTRSELDGITTAGLNNLEMAVVVSGILHHYRLRSGTESTSVPEIVRPADFADRDNEQVWELQNMVS